MNLSGLIQRLLQVWEGPLRREAWDMSCLAAPLALTFLAGVAISTTDIIMIGWLGTEPLAAAALASQYYLLFHLVGIGILAATLPMIAHALGARRFREVRRFVRQGIWAAAAISLPAGFAIWHAGTILPLLGQDPAISALGASYVRVMVWGFAPYMGFVVLSNFAAAHNRPRAVLVVTLLAIVLNAAADYALIFGHFGLPRLELVGAGIATALVNTFMLTALLGYILWDRRFRRYRLLGHFWRPDWPRFAEIFRIGLPIGAMNFAEIGTFIAATFLMGLIGAAELAAHAIALQCATLAFAVPFSLSQAATIRVAHGLGAGDMSAFRMATRVAVGLGVPWGVVGFALMVWFAGPLTGLFLDRADPSNIPALEAATAFIAVVAFYQLVDGPAQGALGVLRGLRDNRVPMVIGFISYWVVGGAACVWLGFGLGYGGVGIWAGLAFGLLVATVMILSRLLLYGERLAVIQLGRRSLGGDVAQLSESEH